MKQKEKFQTEHPILESAAAVLFFILAFCLRRFCLWAYTPSYAHGKSPLRLEATITLCILAVIFLLTAKRKSHAVLVVTAYGSRYKIRLVTLLRRLAVTAGALTLLLSAGHTVELLYVKTAAVNSPSSSSFQESSGPEILASTQIICHALGAPDGITYLNCLEGFYERYAQGVRVFEVDFALAADGTVVLRHDWSMPLQEGIGPTTIPTMEEFLASPLLKTYTPLSFRDLLVLMEEYPDICIITDSKYDQPEIALTQFRAMLDDAKELGLTRLFDRIIIQFYSPTMLEALDRVYDFPHYIYTLYRIGFDQTETAFHEVAEYCASHQICGITMWDYWWDPAYASIAQEYGINVYVHTVNDLEYSRELLDSGVSAVYTDTLTDDMLTSNLS